LPGGPIFAPSWPIGDRLGERYARKCYIDETYVNVNHSTARTWYDVEEGPWVQKPAGKGPRLIVVDASTSAGWVPGARLVFQARRRTGDDHGQMNFANFRKWFSDLLLPRFQPDL